jgi:Flp pilus assembly protein TadD
LGHHRDALAAARKARLRAPHLPQAHYILGCARLAAEQPKGAEQAFRAALDLAPEFADAWLNLGLARYRLADIQGAIAAVRRALAAAPGHRAATANLGPFPRLTDDAPASEALLREANDRDPGNAEARVNLAAGLLRQERAAEALDLLEAAEPPPEPRLSAHWRAHRALALLRLARPAEACRAIDAIEPAGPDRAGLTPLLLWRGVLLTKQEGDGPEARVYAGEREAAIRDAGSLTPEHAVMARFDLARFWSGETLPAVLRGTGA